MNLIAVALAVAGAWFDADVAGSAKWPSGSDPRQRGGVLNPTAVTYDAAKGLALRKCGPVCVNARARDAKGEWSALESVRLTVQSGFMVILR